jgi:hypothetical protein
MKAAERCCAFCLEPRLYSDGWFLLTENRWTDRLKILGWNEALATKPGVHAACGAEHVQQLVIHWMAMGTLDYPLPGTTRNPGHLPERIPAWRPRLNRTRKA